MSDSPTRVGLDAQEPPDLWPLPQESLRNFAGHGWLSFGWDEERFIVTRLTLSRDREVYAAPLTLEGWTSLWRAMVARDPRLAASVSNKVVEVRDGSGGLTIASDLGTRSASFESTARDLRVAKVLASTFKVAAWITLVLGFVGTIVQTIAVAHVDSAGRTFVAFLVAIGSTILGAAILGFFAYVLELLRALVVTNSRAVTSPRGSGDA